MGLLDELLRQVAGGGLGAPPPARSAPSRAGMSSQQGGIGMGQIAAALAPIVIAMLTNRSGSPSAGTGSQAGAGAGGGGLGGILGQILGGGSGASGGGGLGDLLDQFQRAGYGEQAKSWVGTGENQPISPDDLSQVFGKGGISEIARRAGLTEEQASTGLSQLLPEVVDRVTPQGEVPASDQLVRSVDDLTRRLGLG